MSDRYDAYYAGLDFKEMDYNSIKTEMENRLYAAAIMFEHLKGSQRISGNGHHMAQRVVRFCVDLLDERWIEKAQHD